MLSLLLSPVAATPALLSGAGVSGFLAQVQGQFPPFLRGLLYFLFGALALLIVIYVAKLILDQLTLPPGIKQIALIIIGLIGLLVLLGLMTWSFGVF